MTTVAGCLDSACLSAVADAYYGASVIFEQGKQRHRQGLAALSLVPEAVRLETIRKGT